MIQKLKQNKEYVIIFLVVLGICFLFPYSWDDWAWGSKTGIERLNTWFDSYGGRYFGNILALILTRSVILRSVCIATCMAGIVYLLNKLSKSGKVGNYISIILLLFLPVTLLRESVVWTAGFANYGVSIFLTLIYIYYIQNIYSDDKPKYKAITIPFVLVLGFLNALLIEHLTIYNILLGIYVVVFAFIRYRKVFLAHIAYLIGGILGAAWMFSNSAYAKFSKSQDPDRNIKMGGGFIKRITDNYFKDIALHGFLNNVVLNIVLLICAIVLFKKVKSQLSKKQSIIGTTSVIIMTIQVAVSVMNAIMNVNSNEMGSHGFPTSLTDPVTILQYMQGIIGALFILAIIAFVAILPLEKIKKSRLLFIPISIGCIMAPLIVVVPIGGRCFFATYVLFIWLILEFYMMLDAKVKESVENKLVYMRTVVAVSLVFFLYIYGSIFIADKARVSKARADIKKGKKIIYLKDLPHQQYVHGANPIWDEKLEWHKRYKDFYHLKKKVYIINKHSYMFNVIDEDSEKSINTQISDPNQSGVAETTTQK